MVTTNSTTTVALLSIHSEFANAILEGRKTVEFRKNRFSKPIKVILLYATMPEGNIVGVVELKETYQASPQKLWHSFGAKGCISKERFFDYYKNHESGVALEINNAWRLKTPISLEKTGNARAPQSFSYMEVKDLDFLGSRVKVRKRKTRKTPYFKKIAC